MKYYAAVDNYGNRKLFKGMPVRINNNNWIGNGQFPAYITEDFKGFPNITWDDEPIEVELSIKVVKV